MKMTDAEYLRALARGLGRAQAQHLVRIARRLEELELAARLNHDTIVAQQDTEGEEQDG